MSIADESIPFTVGDWRVEPELNRILRGDEIVKIDPRNMKVLQLLASRAGQVIAQNEIENSVWPDVVVTPNSVYQSVAQLRRALGDDKASPRYIETIPKKGYRLVGLVMRAEDHSERIDPSVQPAKKAASLRISHPRVLFALAAAITAAAAAPSALTSLRQELGVTRSHDTETTEGDELIARHGLTIDGTEEPRPLRADVLQQMGEAALLKGRRIEALAHLKDALSLQREIYGDGHQNVGVVLSSLANAYLWNEQYAEAEAAARSAVAAFESLSELHPDRIDAIQRLGEILIERENFSEAKEHIEYSLALSKIVNGESSLKTLEIQSALGILYFAMGQLDIADDLMKKTVPAQAQQRIDHQSEAQCRTSWANILLEQGRFRDSQTQAQLALDLLAKDSRPDHPYIASALEALARSLLRTGDHHRAEVAARRAMQIWQQNDGWSRRVANAASLLGEIFISEGLIAQAEDYLAYASRRLGNPAGRSSRNMHRHHAERLQMLHAAKTQHGVELTGKLIGEISP